MKEVRGIEATAGGQRQRQRQAEKHIEEAESDGYLKWGRGESERRLKKKHGE